MALTTTELRDDWGPSCTPSSELTQFRFSNGVEVTVRKGTEDAWRALDAIVTAYSYVLRQPVTGAYCCRAITGGTGLSLHSFGIACDCNWDTNPYSLTKYVTDMPAAMVQAIRAIRTSAGQQVFVSGADFDNNGVLGDHFPVDAMHFQICCTPTELAGGIDWKTVAGSPALVPDGGDFMAINDADTTYIAGASRVRAVLDLYVECYGPDADDRPGKEYWIDQSTKQDYWSLRTQFLGAVAAAAGVQPAVADGKG